MKHTRIKIFVISSLVSAGVLCIALFLLIQYGPNFNIYLVPPDVESYVQIALNKMDYGIYASGEAWEKQKESVIEKSKGLSCYEDTHDLLREALSVAGGKHSMLFSANYLGTEAVEQEAPTVYIDEQGILYVKLPGFLGTDGTRQYADGVIDYVELNRDQITGVIVDLRGNTGGNLGPMLAALSPFLPDGQLMAFRIHGKDQPVVLSDGAVTGGGTNIAVVPIKVSNVPVAILQDEQTASSAEACLIAFRGLDYVKTFGKNTGGYCSCNTTSYLYDGAMMQLTIGSDVARNGEEFCEEPILPDIETDEPLEEAKKWISTLI